MQASGATVSHESIGTRYRDNFSRDLLALARYFQRAMMCTLQDKCGHDKLRLGYAPYITYLGAGDLRLTELAEAIGVSRQACNQAIKQITNAGYITSHADPTDGRARQLTLSKKGIKLRDDGILVAAELDRQFSDLIGTAAFKETGNTLRQLHTGLGLTVLNESRLRNHSPVLGGLLPLLSDYVIQRLMELTIDKGHPGLKLSFGQVLLLIGPSGGRIQQMAAVHDVSKQAISAIASELEDLGYIRREADLDDARQIVLQLTDKGRLLIADSVQSLEEMECEFREILGRRSFERMTKNFRRLYEQLHGSTGLAPVSNTEDLSSLARRLRQQLGAEGSQALARLLINTE